MEFGELTVNGIFPWQGRKRGGASKNEEVNLIFGQAGINGKYEKSQHPTVM